MKIRDALYRNPKLIINTEYLKICYANQKNLHILNLFKYPYFDEFDGYLFAIGI